MTELFMLKNTSVALYASGDPRAWDRIGSLQHSDIFICTGVQTPDHIQVITKLGVGWIYSDSLRDFTQKLA